jgi:hypothetical protein
MYVETKFLRLGELCDAAMTLMAGDCAGWADGINTVSCLSSWCSAFGAMQKRRRSC